MLPDVKASDDFTEGDILRLRPDTPGRAHKQARWGRVAWTNPCEINKGRPVEVERVDDEDWTLRVFPFDTPAGLQFNKAFWVCPSWCIKTTREEVEQAGRVDEGARQTRNVRAEADAILAMQLRITGLGPGQIPYKEWKVGDTVQTSRRNVMLSYVCREELFRITDLRGEGTDFHDITGLHIDKDKSHLHGGIGPREHLTWISRL